MISYEQFRAEIEAEREWREEEVRLLKNQISKIEIVEEQKKLRKALIVMLYAYFEGICKFSLIFYVKYINELNLKIDEASIDIQTCAISDILHALTNTQKKSPYFSNTFPDDEKLHRYYRNREFVREFPKITSSIVKIDDKIVINTESNLIPSVLKKILFQLGLQYSEVDKWSSPLNKLLHYRNKIAHGSFKDGIEKEVYQDIEEATFLMISEVILFVSQSISETRYLKNESETI